MKQEEQESFLGVDEIYSKYYFHYNYTYINHEVNCEINNID